MTMDWGSLASESLPSVTLNSSSSATTANAMNDNHGSSSFSNGRNTTTSMFGSRAPLVHRSREPLFPTPPSAWDGSGGTAGNSSSAPGTLALTSGATTTGTPRINPTAPAKNNNNIRHHHHHTSYESMLERLIADTDQRARDKISRRLEEQMDAHLEHQQKLRQRQHLGNGTTTTPSTLALPSSYTTTNATQSLVVRPSASSLGVAASSLAPSITRGHRNQPPLDREMVQWHLNILQQQQQAHQAAPLASLERLELAVPEQVGAYRHALQLAQHLHHHNHHATGRAVATLAHLARQFRQSLVTPTAGGSATGGSSSSAQSVVDQVQNFVQFHLGSTSSSTASPWPTVYFLLRAGHVAGAWKALNQTTSAVDAAIGPVRAILERWMQRRQGRQQPLMSMSDNNNDDDDDNLWLSPLPPQGLPPALRVPLADRQELQSLEASGSGSSSNGPAQDLNHVYQRGVLSLLSGGLVEFPKDGTGFQTIEDYIYGNLWHIITSSPEPEIPSELDGLAESIREYGPAYFQAAAGTGSASGWSYAIPLLLTQQYRAGLVHLSNSSPQGLLEAAHLCLFWPSSSSSNDNNNLVATQTHIVVAYAELLLVQSGDAGLAARGALEYLARLPDRSQARHRVAKLIADTRALELLVGQIDSQGLRVRPTPHSCLDQHFSETDIPFILEQAATLLWRPPPKAPAADQDATNAACKCYMLAGQFGKALSLLHSLVAPHVTVDHPHRQYWLDQLQSFQAAFVETGSTVVAQSLQRDSPELLQTSRILLQLNHFFGLVRDRRWEDAEGLLLGQPVASALAPLLRAAPDAAILRTEYPYFLAAAMEVYHGLFQQVRYQSHPSSGSGGVTAARLGQLQDQARQILDLAAAAVVPHGSPLLSAAPNNNSSHHPSPQEVMTRLSHLEAQMIL